MKFKNGAGFTLIELIIVIVILAIVAALSIPFFQTFQSSSDLYTNTNTIVKTLRRAQQQSVAGKNGSGWGVFFDDGNKKFILFLGSDYASRDSEYDQETGYSQSISVSTDFGDEIYFSQYSSQPSSAGIVTVADTVSGANEAVTISNIGLIQIN